MTRILVVGSLNMDLVVPVPRLAREGETLAGGDLALIPGGKGANQACAAAKLGGHAAMIGQVGSDVFGTKLIDGLRAAGADTSGIGISEGATGTAFIAVLPSGENSILISPGANAKLTPNTAVDRIANAERSGFLLCQLEVPLVTVDAVLGQARRNGIVTILDPAPAKPLPRDLLSLVDWLTPNQTEAELLLSAPEGSVRTFSDARDAALRLREWGPRGVIVKLGELGCYVSSPDADQPVEGFRVNAVDTTAAGDTFNGALAVALAEGKPILEAAKFANAAAAISVTRAGAQSSIPSRKEVEEFLRRPTGRPDRARV
ncbi:MAG: ribokinase [Bryobacteraceae bacterium]|jgi:ribokinase